MHIISYYWNVWMVAEQDNKKLKTNKLYILLMLRITYKPTDNQWQLLISEWLDLEISSFEQWGQKQGSTCGADSRSPLVDSEVEVGARWCTDAHKTDFELLSQRSFFLHSVLCYPHLDDVNSMDLVSKMEITFNTHRVVQVYMQCSLPLWSAVDLLDQGNWWAW